MKAHQLSIVLPSKSRLVQLRIYTCYTKTCFFLGVTCYFSRITYFWSIVLFRCNTIFASNMTRQMTLTSLNRKGNTTDMKIYNSRYLLIFFLNFDIYQAEIFSLVLPVIFPELLTSGQLYYSDVMILFDLYIIFELFLKL
jgi:hypothetical protein